MSINGMVSLPFIAFGLLALIIEVSGHEIVFHGFHVSIKKGQTTWDSLNIGIMFLSAVTYAGALASTAGITIVEGYSWLRPGNALAPLLGYMFGLPGCLGVGLGELFTDSFGGYYSWGSIGGFVGNFLLAYIPHKVVSDPPLRHTKEVLYYGVLVGGVSTITCAYVILGILDILNTAGIVTPIPVLTGVTPPIQRLSEEVVWNDLFKTLIMNNAPMNLAAGPLIVGSFHYLSEKGLFWRDRLGLFDPRKDRREFFSLLILGVITSYAIYNASASLGIYGKIGRSEDYVVNILGIAFFTLGLLGFAWASIQVVKGRILSIIMGKRSVDARALEVYFAARRDTAKEGSDEETGERLGRLLFSKILSPSLAKLLQRLRIETFVQDYLRYIIVYMMNSRCSVKQGPKDHSKLILIDECIVCKGIRTDRPACGLAVGFLRGLTEAFAETVKGKRLKVETQETECIAMGKESCKIELGWSN